MIKHTFLFWNLNKKALFKEIASIVQRNNIDILVFAEFPEGKEYDLLLELNKASETFYPPSPVSFCKKIVIYSKFHYDFLKPIYEDHRMTIRKLESPISKPILLAAIHFPDKGSFNNDSQHEHSSIVSRKIKEIENEQKINDTILVGDFNMNPFEIGMIKSTGFHATMSTRTAQRKTRVVQGIEYDFFYNPMWSLYGDLHSKNVAGTYYYSHAEHVSYIWNVFDQVLLRPSLINNFDASSLNIIHEAAGHSLLFESGIPNSTLFSDHLPITFTIKI